MAQFFTWLLVIVGWATVHCLTVRREHQKEVRDLKSALIEKIFDIEQEATEFHIRDTHDFQCAQRLLGNIARVGNQLSRLQLKCLDVAPKYVKRFRQSITLKNFDKGCFEKQAPDAMILLDIFTASEELVDAIETAYTAKYFDRWW